MYADCNAGCDGLNKPKSLMYSTRLGALYNYDSSKIFDKSWGLELKKNVNLIFTSPPFPLNRRKSYGNKSGKEYIEWLAPFAKIFGELLTSDGSVVIEMGNAWKPGEPVMSTLSLEALMRLKEEGQFHLCQEFIWYNPARLPSPAQWVNVDRIRVKDSFTRLWWLSKTTRPKADNRRILREYSKDMKHLLRTKKYNSGRRPSEHVIGERSFLKNNNGSIPSNVITLANTNALDDYLEYCKKNEVAKHPARMPIGLAEFFIKFLTEPGDLVLDPFAGSNVTGYAAETLGRRWVSIELDPVFAESSLSRFSSSEDENKVNFVCKKIRECVIDR